MRITTPIKITDAMLVSSTVPEDDAPVYSAGTTYALGAKVISNHRVYESAQAANTGNPVSDPTWWTDIGPTKRWAAFDDVIGTYCTGASPLEVVLAPGQRVNTVALLDVSGIETVRVRSSVGAATIYDRSIDVRSTRAVRSWWEYFFAPRSAAKQAIFDGLPPVTTAQITITCTGSAPSVGVICAGLTMEFADAQLGVSIGIIDYSAKETDSFGVTSVVERAYAKRANVSFVLPRQQVDAFAKLLADLRAKPALWRVSDRHEVLTIYGWVRDWSQAIAYPTLVTGDMTIEGLI